jgi:site-specific recombinase XerD
MTSPTPPQTITAALEAHIAQVSHARSRVTVKTYRQGLKHFLTSLRKSEVDPDQAGPGLLSDPAHFLHLIEHLQAANLVASTQKLYLSAVMGFYKFLDAYELAQVNLSRLQTLASLRVEQPGYRLPQFPKEEIERVIAYAQSLAGLSGERKRQRWIDLRDRAFILTLADTGLRVHEACGLRRGDFDWNEGRALVTGKGNKQAVIRFSERALMALKDYLNARANLDGQAGRQLTALPLFARHDKKAGKNKVKPISTETGRNIIKGSVRAALGEEAVGSITPHSFRHYFVTTVLRATGGDIHAAQKLARHSNINVTERYAHLSDDELDRTYHEVFNEASSAKHT